MIITAAEIARMCGVSRTTVDRALKNKSGISAETRRRICEIADRYGYRPNYLASSLSTGQTKSVGIIVFDLYNQHFSFMVTAMEKYLSEHGILAYICISDKDKKREWELIDDLNNRRVDGIAFVPINFSKAFVEHLRSLHLPIVAVSNRLPGFPFVGGDGAAAVYSGMECFFAHGYRTVHFVCPPVRFRGRENLYTQEDRLSGYLKFMQEHPDMRGEVLASEDYLERLEALIQNAEERPGVFCSSDHFTLNIRRRIVELGWDLDSCCYLMGFDGLEFLQHLTPRPASVFYPAEEIGRSAAQLLMDLIHGNPAPQEIMLPCPLLPGTVRM